MTKIRSTITAILAGLAINAHADSPKQINIPAGDLVAALETLAKQSDVDLVYRAEQLKGVHTKGINATLTTQDAVKKLLEGTQLRVRTDDETGAMMISPAPPSNERPIAAAPEAKNPEASLEEIIVTAQKRGDERLQDVPIPMSGIDTGDPASNGHALL